MLRMRQGEAVPVTANGPESDVKHRVKPRPRRKPAHTRAATTATAPDNAVEMRPEESYTFAKDAYRAQASEDYRGKIDDKKVDLLVRQLATEELNAELIAARWNEQAIDSCSAAELLDREDVAEPYLVDGLMKHGHNVVLGAVYKTGKTLTGANLAASLVDGKPFLGKFSTHLPDGKRVGWWNGEMTWQDLRDDYLRPLNVANTDRIQYMNLRGRPMPILDDTVAERAAKWLHDNKVDVWVIDSWRVLLAWSHIEENDNSGAGQLTARLDEIKAVAGVSECFILAHMPRAQQAEGEERVRGAAALDDWQDARWIITKSGDTRFIAVNGRVKGIEATALNHSHGVLTLGTASKRDVARDTNQPKAVAFVASQPGSTTTQVAVGIGKGDRHTAEVSTALRAAEVEGSVYHRDRASGKGRYWHPGQRPADQPCTCEWGG